jgi:NADPH:quinone reductase-like Zn-dependent oxidoreductase
MHDFPSTSDGLVSVRPIVTRDALLFRERFARRGPHRRSIMYAQNSGTQHRVLVTGSSEGLGLMAARLLAEQGHAVTLHARNDARATTARAALPAAERVLIGDVSTIAGHRGVFCHEKPREVHPAAREPRLQEALLAYCASVSGVALPDLTNRKDAPDSVVAKSRSLIATGT